jgi:prenyltransferase beta subunit
MNLFQSIEETARKGADGLRPEARDNLFDILRSRCAPDGGYTDLSQKQSDPYYSLFAWLCLRALSHTPLFSLEQYFATCRAQSPIDHFCKAFVQIHSMPPFKRKLASLCLLIRHPPHNPYALFLSALLLNMSFPRLAPLLLSLTRKYNTHALSTSRLAAQLLANPRASDAPLIRKKLLQRHSKTGGFSSADHAEPDLLATAVARIALSSESPDTSSDLLFAEACWCPDGLFAALPGSACGDVEHTYYALLVLGTCRA